MIDPVHEFRLALLAGHIRCGSYENAVDLSGGCRALLPKERQQDLVISIVNRLAGAQASSVAERESQQAPSSPRENSRAAFASQLVHGRTFFSAYYVLRPSKEKRLNSATT
jgi:hypothetical protein